MTLSTSLNGGSQSIRAVARKYAVPAASGVIAQIVTRLKSPVSFSGKTGHENLSISASGQLVADAPIPSEQSQQIGFLATGADGCTQPWQITLEGAADIDPPLPAAALTFTDGTPLQFSDGSYLELLA